MKRAFAALVLAVVCATAVGALWWLYAVFADRSHPTRPTEVIVPRGASLHQIAGELAKAGVIGNPTAFRLYAKLRHAESNAHAGEFRFSGHITQTQVLDQLQSGGSQIAKWVTFPEGFTAKQIALRLEREGFGDWRRFYDAFMHDSIVVGGSRTKNLEGYLFPSTYLIPLGASPKTVEALMTAQFFRELPPDARTLARRHSLTVPQVVTLASLIQWEAKADDERPLMAGVYYNRLRAGMPLEVDAALEYAFPQHRSVITYADLKTESPYNTYLHAGLPPTPISNPGEPSLRAAFHPLPSQFLYYVYKGNGHHVFAKTLAQQNANIAKYLK